MSSSPMANLRSGISREMSSFRLISIGLAFLASCATVAQTTSPSGLFPLSLDQEEPAILAVTNIVIATAPLPGAKELGQLEVEKWDFAETANGGRVTAGWHCSKETPPLPELFSSDLPFYYVADDDTAVAHLAQVAGIQKSLPNVDNPAWRDAGVAWMMARLRLYETSGKPNLYNRPDFPRFAWRLWMRDTLAVVHSRAKDAGWSQEKTAEAATLWVYCHIGPDEWTGIRREIVKALAGGAAQER